MGRRPVDRERIERFLRELGSRYHGGGRLYLVGGSQMVYYGFRSQTEDIDYVARLEGDEREFIPAIRSLITDFDLSVEQAGPGDFIPLPSGWEDRGRFIGRYGRLDIFTFDPISTALSKIERGLTRDVDDALTLIKVGAVDLADLIRAFEEVVARLGAESVRVEEGDFRRKFEAFLSLARQDSGRPIDG